MGFQLNQITPFGTIMLVFELLWDIAFAILILRLAFFYYAFTILTGVILGIVRVRVFVRSHHYGAPIAELIEMPFMLLAIAFWAMFLVIRFDIPKVAWMRLAIGSLGLAFMLATEIVGKIILYGSPWSTSTSTMEILAKGASAGCLIMFGLMPWLLMLPIGERTELGEKLLCQGGLQSDNKEYVSPRA
jgi:hypothetical protein